MKKVLALFALLSSADVVCAEDVTQFRLYTTDDAVYKIASAEELSSLLPVYRIDGDTVTATAWDGTQSTLDRTSFVPQKTGIWSLVSSSQGSATIAIATSINGNTFPLDNSDTYKFRVDAEQEGPNRKATKSGVLPIAYSGDNWLGDLKKASSLTFTSPNGTENVLPSLRGTDAIEFKFDTVGTWTVLLTMEDASTRTATISISVAGTVVSLI